MLRQALPVALSAVGVLAPFDEHADDKLVLKSVTIDLPEGDLMLPAGPGSDVANNNCLACHSADMVLNQPAMSQAQWRSEVDKTGRAYKEPLDPKEGHPSADYLT